jgi:transglutaminase-like putative cysteine protease
MSTLTPSDKGGTIGTDPLYGNQLLYFQATAQQDDLTVIGSNTFKVTRHEVRTASGPKHKPGAKENIDRFLQADKLVPLEGKPLDLIKGVNLGANQLEIARTFYNVVNRHMKYSKEGIGWGNGDAVWACDSKFGNCSDFHSLFISLARSQKIPAKFEMGFPIPTKRGEGTIGGYHCWAWFLPDNSGWVPVDISEANRFPEMRDYYFGNLSEDRVAFTTGRDIDLVPRQAGAALNFFIYPYAEVDGQALPAGQIQQSFSYKDVN